MGNELYAAFAARCKPGSDISEHLPKIAELAAECSHVTEFGVRSGLSTTAILYGLSLRGSGTLKSYDIAPHCAPIPTLPAGVAWQFEQADTAKLGEIEPTDMLLLDSWHTAEHVAAELRHHENVSRYLVFHDTTTFAGAGQGDGGAMGICPAIFNFLTDAACYREWLVYYHNQNNNGLLVLKRFGA
jgi:hypothetical protein